MNEPTMSPEPDSFDDVEGHGNFSNADKFNGRPNVADQDDDDRDRKGADYLGDTDVDGH